VTQAVFQRAYLAEPLPLSRLSEPTDGAGLDLVQAGRLGRVHPQERALDAGFSELTTLSEQCEQFLHSSYLIDSYSNACSNCLAAILAWEAVVMSVIQGSVILESLRVGTRLSGLKLRVREIYRFLQEDPGPGQPDTWGVLEWEADEADAAEIAQAFSEVLDQPGWYVDFRSEQETFVVFPGRVFCYRRGDAAGRAEALAHAQTLQIPQLDWPV